MEHSSCICRLPGMAVHLLRFAGQEKVTERIALRTESQVRSREVDLLGSGRSSRQKRSILQALPGHVCSVPQQCLHAYCALCNDFSE